MTAKRRLIATLFAICSILLLTGAPLLPISAAPLVQSPAWHIETVDSVGDVGWGTSITVDDLGNPHISYYDSTNGDLKYARWDGSGWQIEIVDSVVQGGVGYIAWDTSITLDGAGHPHISYCSGVSKYAQWDGLAWQIETVDTIGSVGWYTSLALDGDGYAHISHYQDHVYDLRYSRWDGSIWHSETVDSSGQMGAFSSLALDVGDYPHVSYWDDSSENLKYAYLDSIGWHIETVDSAGDVGRHTSLALDSLDHPHVSYVDRTNHTLKYTHWGGSGWQIEAVDTIGDCGSPSSPPQVGCDTSLALGTEGDAHISYRDSANDDLRYAHWGGSSWQTETLDSDGDVGQENSLALDAAGSPHVSYYDATNADLKYAHQGLLPTPTPTSTPTSTPTATSTPTPTPTATPTTTINVYTDKASYSAGEAMHFGLDMTTAGSSQNGTQQLQSYWLLILLRTPSTGVVLVNLPSLRLPSGWSYTNPDLFTWTLPPMEPGTYSWIGMLVPVGEEPAVDSAIWELTGTSGQRIVTAEKALKRLGGVEIDLGR